MTSSNSVPECAVCGHPADVHAAGECWIRRTLDGGWTEATSTPTDCDCPVAVAAVNCVRCGPDCRCGNPLPERRARRTIARTARAATVETLLTLHEVQGITVDTFDMAGDRLGRIALTETRRELRRRGYVHCSSCHRWHQRPTEPVEEVDCCG